MKAVQQTFKRRGKGSVADSGIISTAAADSKFPGTVFHLRRSQVDTPEIGRMQDILNRGGSIRGKPQGTGKIIAGAGGNIGKGDL